MDSQVPYDRGLKIERWQSIFVQKVVDFEALKKEDFAEHKHVFCLLGTTRGKAGVDGFVKVDKEYVQNVAKISKEGTHFKWLRPV